MTIDLNWLVAVVAVTGTVAGFGLKLVTIGMGILNRINTMDTKLEVGLSTLAQHDSRMTQQDERMNRIETRVQRLEHYAPRAHGDVE